MESSLRAQWNQACLTAGIPVMSEDKCARLLAVLYVYGGGDEQFVMNKNFTDDVLYIQKRFNVQGGCIPDTHFCVLLKKYVRNLELLDKLNKKPQWAARLMKEKYNIILK